MSSWLAKVPHLLPVPRPQARASSARRVVVMLHGTGSEPGVFRHLSRALHHRGIHAVALPFGRRGTGDLDDAVAELESQLARIDAPVVDIVGHSLGGLLALRLANRPALRGRIRTIVGLGAAWRGVPDRLGRGRRRVTRTVLGESFVQVRTPDPWDAAIPPGVEVISVVSDADTVVPESSSRLGRVVEISGVRHRHLPGQVDVVLRALAGQSCPGDADSDSG